MREKKKAALRSKLEEARKKACKVCADYSRKKAAAKKKRDDMIATRGKSHGQENSRKWLLTLSSPIELPCDSSSSTQLPCNFCPQQ